MQIKDFPLLLEYERKKRKLSLRDVEDEIGISHATLSRIERGYAFDIPTLEKIVAWLGLEVQIIGFVEKPVFRPDSKDRSVVG